jgi:hypothetical protein
MVWLHPLLLLLQQRRLWMQTPPVSAAVAVGPQAAVAMVGGNCPRAASHLACARGLGCRQTGRSHAN